MRFRILNQNPMLDYREACKVTEGIDLLADTDTMFLTPKDEVAWWIKQIVANHSTLRVIHFNFVAKAPKSVIMQLIRATKGHPQPEVESSRPDWTGEERSSDPYEEKLFVMEHTAESFIAMARQRMCLRTELPTYNFMIELVETLRTSEVPFLKAVGVCCAPACTWYGLCPEIRSCGRKKKLSDFIIDCYKKHEKEKENVSEKGSGD